MDDPPSWKGFLGSGSSSKRTAEVYSGCVFPLCFCLLFWEVFK